MSENQNRGNTDLEKYSSMATEALEEILRLDAEMPEGQESDTDKILYIMEVLAERKRKHRHTGNTAPEAYESFKQNYLPETDPDTVPATDKPRGRRWLGRLTAVAAVLAILVLGSITAKAFGFNIWKAVIQWTQETFHFGAWGDADPDHDRSYASLEEALEQGKITTPLTPTWIPAGYEIVDVTTEQSPLKKTYSAKYASGEKILRITIRDYLDKDTVYVEQGDGLAEEYEAHGITYYLFDNNKRTQVVWIVDSYECCISGEVTIDELKMMISSIEKG